MSYVSPSGWKLNDTVVYRSDFAEGASTRCRVELYVELVHTTSKYEVSGTSYAGCLNHSITAQRSRNCASPPRTPLGFWDPIDILVDADHERSNYS